MNMNPSILLGAFWGRGKANGQVPKGRRTASSVTVLHSFDLFSRDGNQNVCFRPSALARRCQKAALFFKLSRTVMVLSLFRKLPREGEQRGALEK
jgi:hypothetical protein